MAEDKGKQQGGVGLAIGTKIGRYELVERLAIGGQAIVYKGYDPALDRHVAIKQISTHLAEDPKFLERFRNEAQILARLGSEQPAIVTIHELIEQTEGLFIVMEYVSGHRLEKILKDTDAPAEPKAALQVLFRLAAALHDVHAAGIVHRDIKPSNIIIGEGLRPKITDFGVAASVTGQTSMVLGTTKYMAPELFEGGEVDARADVYSLGVVAYEMLAGRPKFNEIFADIIRDPHSEALRWMKWHGNADLVAPPLSEVNPAIPKALSDIVAQMMAKDRQERFASMEELGRAMKLEFSPGARGAAAGAGRPKWRRKRAAAAEAALQEKADLEPRDGADELEVQADTTPTSHLPTRALSLRTKLILGAVIFLGVLGVVVGLVIKQNMAKSREAAAAREAFAEPNRQYEQGRHAEALAGFEDLRQRFRGTRESAMALILIPLCKAHLAVLEEDPNAEWKLKARAAVDEAEANLKKVQRARVKLPPKWVEKVEAQIERFESDIPLKEIFRRAIQDARVALEQGEFDRARAFLGRMGIAPTPAQELQIKTLRKEIDLKEFWTVYNRHVETGDSRGADADKTGLLETFAEARAAYDKAGQWLRSAKGDVLDVEQRKQLAGDLAARRRKLSRRRDYRAAMIAADKARKDGDRDEELAHLQTAYKITPTPALKKRIGAIRSDISFEQAGAALADEKYAEAERLFSLALKHNPDNARAKEALDELERSGERRKLVAAGDRALAAGDYADALKSFRAAVNIEASDDLKTKIIECRFQMHLADARRLRKVAESHRPPVATEYDDALVAYEKARAVKPSEGEMVAAEIATMKRRQQYEQWAAKAAAAEAKQRWQTMLDAWNQAKELRENMEVTEGIARAKYGGWLARGKDALAVQDFRGALGYFELAKGQAAKAGISPDEVDRLIAQVKEKL